MNTKQIERFLLKEWNKESNVRPGFGRSVSIETWPHNASFGLRVAEVGFTERPKNGALAGTSGSVFMQCDTGGLTVCALVERLALEGALDTHDEERIKQQLVEACFAAE